jgi:hypothetical protein
MEFTISYSDRPCSERNLTAHNIIFTTRTLIPDHTAHITVSIIVLNFKTYSSTFIPMTEVRDGMAYRAEFRTPMIFSDILLKKTYILIKTQGQNGAASLGL